MRITVAVTAKNEEGTIAECLRSLISSIELAESTSAARFDLVVVIDDCTDATEAIAKTFPRVTAALSSGGLVEAQRTIGDREPFVIFSDADILVSPETIGKITEAMFSDPALEVAYPAKTPRKPARRTALAFALHTYNLNDGFETKRSHFNGKLFAIRHWHIPTRLELSARIDKLPDNPFYHFESGVLADDIYLSKSVLKEHGPGAIREIPDAQIHYQAAETFEGMHRYYRRMRMELERVSYLFPEFNTDTSNRPKRRTDWARLKTAGFTQQVGWFIFQAAFRLCKLRYHLERIYYSHLSSRPCPFWPTVVETKTFSCSVGNRTE
ncbi:MAG: glycosyltransferase [Verrucomicrobiales bacterium]|nr:glycosyltransferase [Verrucomicrobiales bacterium]